MKIIQFNAAFRDGMRIIRRFRPFVLKVIAVLLKLFERSFKLNGNGDGEGLVAMDDAEGTCGRGSGNADRRGTVLSLSFLKGEDDGGWMACVKAVEEMVRKLVVHFDCQPSCEVHVGTSDNPFRMLRSKHGEVLKTGRWLCRRASSRKVAEEAMSRLGELGMTVKGSDGGWGFVYAFKEGGGGEA